jgi:putative transposase
LGSRTVPARIESSITRGWLIRYQFSCFRKENQEDTFHAELKAQCTPSALLYHRHRFPVEIISHSVWLYFRFALSFRDVEEMMSSRGVHMSYESVREWCRKFDQTCANSNNRAENSHQPTRLREKVMRALRQLCRDFAEIHNETDVA